MRTKIIVTNESAMQRKYTDKWSSIVLLLNCLIEHDLKRGIATQVIYLDHPLEMNGRQVTDCKNEKQNKDAVDFICQDKNPAYLILLGAWDIIPFQNLIDPMKISGVMPSDLPYACNAPYSKNSNNFTDAERIVSRLPDVVGSKEKGFDVLVRTLNAILHSTRKPKTHFALPWAVCTSKRKFSMEKSLRDMYGISNVSSLCHVAPPEGPSWKLGYYDKSVHFNILHGGKNRNTLYGESPEERPVYPVAVNSSDIDGNLSTETIVLTMSCFGSQLYAPKRGQTLPFANMYFYSNASAMVGCLEQTYSIPDECGGGRTLGDRLLSEFFINLNNRSVGEAFLLARQTMKNNSFLTRPHNLRMFATFTLYGDASLIPMADDSFDETTLPDSIKIAVKSDRDSFIISSAIPHDTMGSRFQEIKEAITAYLSEHYENAEIIDIICNTISLESDSDQEDTLYTAICRIDNAEHLFTFIEKEDKLLLEQQYAANRKETPVFNHQTTRGTNRNENQ